MLCTILLFSHYKLANFNVFFFFVAAVFLFSSCTENEVGTVVTERVPAETSPPMEGKPAASQGVISPTIAPTATKLRSTATNTPTIGPTATIIPTATASQSPTSIVTERPTAAPSDTPTSLPTWTPEPITPSPTTVVVAVPTAESKIEEPKLQLFTTVENTLRDFEIFRNAMTPGGYKMFQGHPQNYSDCPALIDAYNRVANILSLPPSDDPVVQISYIVYTTQTEVVLKAMDPWFQACQSAMSGGNPVAVLKYQQDVFLLDTKEALSELNRIANDLRES